MHCNQCHADAPGHGWKKIYDWCDNPGIGDTIQIRCPECEHTSDYMIEQACVCCGGTDYGDGDCGGPLVTLEQCIYFTFDETKEEGNRFVCIANSRQDGKCDGKLEWVGDDGTND